jgi:hypothetical protein
MFDVHIEQFVPYDQLPVSIKEAESDQVQVPQWHPLDITTIDIKHMPVINGFIPRDNSFRERTYTNYPVYYLVADGTVIPPSWWTSFPTATKENPVWTEASSDSIWNPYAPHVQHLDMSEDFVPAQTVLASCNPTRAALDVPAETFETLTDLSALVLLKGKSLSGHAGKVNLAFEFGWKPLIADVKILLKMSKLVDKRVASLKHLRVGRQSAKGNVHKSHRTEESYFTIPLSDDTGLWYMVTYKLTRTTKLDQWGCVEYMAPQAFLDRLTNMSSSELRTEALIQLTKAKFWTNPSGWWEVTPFSWLADWFYDFQDFLERYSTVELLPWRYCVMTRLTTVSKAEAINIDSLYEGVDINLEDLAFECTKTTRERIVGYDTLPLPNISGHMPTFTNRQAGILASLFAIYKDFGKKVSTLGSLRRL